VKPTARRPAVFSSPENVYHADTCDLLKQAAERNELKLVAFGRRGYPGKPLATRILPELPSIGYWDAPGDQTWGLAWHRNEGIELTFIARGTPQLPASITPLHHRPAAAGAACGLVTAQQGVNVLLFDFFHLSSLLGVTLVLLHLLLGPGVGLAVVPAIRH
jgi:hypothetical protein